MTQTMQTTPLHRIWIRAPMPYVEGIRERYDQKTLLRDVENRLSRLGFEGTVLVMQDPSDNTVLTALTRCQQAPGSRLQAPAGDGVIRIERAERVEELPPPFRCSGDGPRLDPGLSEDEIAAVWTALRTEDNPRHLEGFASTLDPWFPVSASLLNARKKKLDVYTGRSLYDHPDAIDRTELRDCRARFYAYVTNHQIPLDLAENEVKRAACLLTLEPPPHVVKEHLRTNRVPREVLDLAFCLVKQDREGFPVVDPEAVRVACPPTGEEGFVSPSALQLALALGKPEISGVRSRSQAAGIAADIEHGRGASDPYAKMKAQAAMEKAQRTLERQRWTNWYRKQD